MKQATLNEIKKRAETKKDGIYQYKGKLLRGL